MNRSQYRMVLLLLILLAASITHVSFGQAPSPTRPLTHFFSKLESPKSFAKGLNRREATPTLAAKGKSWEFSCSGVNRINAVAVVGQKTWLGTDCGIKMLDNETKTVTHYTQVDGLPGEKTVAISADAVGVFCIQTLKRMRNQHEIISYAEFCSFDFKTGKWRNLSEVQYLDQDSFGSVYSENVDYTGYPNENFLVSISSERACFSFCPINIGSKVFAYCYDRRTRLLEEIPVDESVQKEVHLQKIAWLDVEREGVWFGTNHGIRHWSFLEKRWDWRLNDLAIYSGIRAEDGTYWVAAFDATTKKPNLRRRQNAGVNALMQQSDDRWKLISFNRNSLSTSPEQVLKLPQLVLYKNESAPQNIVTANKIRIIKGRIWISFKDSVHISYCPKDMQFDPKYLRIAADDYSEAQDKDVSERMFRTGDNLQLRIPTELFPVRDQNQYCEIHKNSWTPLHEYAAEYLSDDPDGSKWSTLGSQLNHYSKSGLKKEIFQLYNATVPVLAPIVGVASLGDTVYALTERELQAYNVKTKIWKKISIPLPRLSTENSYNTGSTDFHRLIVVGESLLVSIGTATFRYYPRKNILHSESLTYTGRDEAPANSSYASNFGLAPAKIGYTDNDGILGVEENAIWISNKSRQKLWRADLISQLRVEYPFPKLPDEFADKGYASPIPLTFSKGALFFELLNSKLKTSLLIGFEPKSGEWTNAMPFSSGDRVSCSTCVNGEASFLGLFDTAHALYEYDPKKRLLNLFFEFDQALDDIQYYDLVSVNSTEIWIYNRRDYKFMSVDRIEKKLKFFAPLRASVPPYGDYNSPYPVGTPCGTDDGFFFPTSQGVWSFNRQKHLLERLPGLPLHLRNAYISSIDSKSVWLSGSSKSQYRAHNIVKFDKATSECKVWAISDGSDPGIAWRRIFSAGASSWALSYQNDRNYDDYSLENDHSSPGSSLFRLESKTNEWVNVSKLIDIKIFPIHFKLAVNDSDSIWLLTEKTLDPWNHGVPAINPLCRYEIATGKITTLNPLPEHSAIYTGLQVDPLGVWLIGEAGVFRYSKLSHLWSKVEPPIESRKLALFTVERVERHGAEVSFIGKDRVITFDY